MQRNSYEKEQEGKVLTDSQKEEIVDHAIQLIKNRESISNTCEITGISSGRFETMPGNSVKTFHPRDSKSTPIDTMERYSDGGVSSKVHIDTTCQEMTTQEH